MRPCGKLSDIIRLSQNKRWVPLIDCNIAGAIKCDDERYVSYEKWSELQIKEEVIKHKSGERCCMKIAEIKQRL